jgi:hypothetical protein
MNDAVRPTLEILHFATLLLASEDIATSAILFSKYGSVKQVNWGISSNGSSSNSAEYTSMLS